MGRGVLTLRPTGIFHHQKTIHCKPSTQHILISTEANHSHLELPKVAQLYVELWLVASRQIPWQATLIGRQRWFHDHVRADTAAAHLQLKSHSQVHATQVTLTAQLRDLTSNCFTENFTISLQQCKSWCVSNRGNSGVQGEGLQGGSDGCRVTHASVTRLCLLVVSKICLQACRFHCVFEPPQQQLPACKFVCQMSKRRSCKHSCLCMVWYVIAH